MEQTINSQKIYAAAKSCIGKHISLDASIPNEVNCAEAVSYILKECGYAMPQGGIPGTASLLIWLQSSTEFTEIDTYISGAIVLSATGSGNGKIPGHTGVCANYGILSNDSNTGLFLELWNINKWRQYYESFGGMKTHFFLAK